MVSKLVPSTSGVVVSTTASARPVLAFRNFSVRCDKSNPQVIFETPWNWEFGHGKRIAVISKNYFLRYQLSACMAGLVPSASGEILGNSVIGWPVGGDGGLDKKMRISHAVNFLSTVYADCLDQSCVSLKQFWGLMSDFGIDPSSIIKDLSREKKDFFYLALSVLFAFDCYLIPKVKFLMSRPASPLRALLLEQVQGRMLFATAANVRFQHEFCTDGIVLGGSGQILFAGEILNAIQWADDNLASSNELESEENGFDVKFNLTNSEAAGDGIDDLEAWS